MARDKNKHAEWIKQVALGVVFLCLTVLLVFIFGAICYAGAEPAEDINPAPAAVSGHAGSAEDMFGTNFNGWLNDSNDPEDIKPLKAKRKVTNKESNNAGMDEEKTEPEVLKPAVESKPAPNEAAGAATPPLLSETAPADVESKEKKETQNAPETKSALDEDPREPSNENKNQISDEENDAAGEKKGAPADRTMTAPASKEESQPRSLPPPFPPTSKDTKPTRGPNTPGKIKISGNLELKLQSASATGHEIGFLSQNGLLYFNDSFQQRTNLNVDGLLKSGTRVSGVFVEAPYQDRTFTFNLSGARGRAALGDTPAVFRAGPMARFQKSIRGLDFEYDFGAVTVAALVSRQKSDTAREAFRGANIRGPYILQTTSILENSESIYINGHPLSSADYSMGYFLGQVTFNRNIDPTDLVEITYESVLQVAMKTGSLNGISINSNPRNKRFDAGAAYLEEGTNRTQRETVLDTIKTFPGADITPNAVYSLGQTKLKKSSEIASVSTATYTLLTRDIDYTMDYPEGKISFLRAFSASDTVRVTYSYYNREYLQFVENEELRGSGKDSYILQKERIYGGTEYVYMYINEVFSRKLESGADYAITEANNSIEFLNPNVRPESTEGRHAEISYEIVPAVTLAGADSKRTISDLTGRLSVGRAVFRAEYSETESDATLKTIQVLDERVATVGATSDGVFPLQHDAIRNTEEIFFNDTVSPNSRRIQGADYVMEYDSALAETVLRFKNTIPVGTTIIANYKYAPELPEDPERKGKAGRITVETQIPRGNLQGEFMRKSCFYAPPTQYNDLETDRSSLGLKFTPFRRFSFAVNWLDQKHGTDFTNGVSIGTNELNGQTEYSFGRGRRIGFSFTRRSKSDNLDSHATDHNQNARRLESRYAVDSREKIVLDSHFENRDFTDATRRTSDFDVLKGGFGFTYPPSPKFNLKLSADNNRVKMKAPESIGSAGDFTLKTLSNVLQTNYQPDKVWSFSAKIDAQGINDSRESVGGARVDNMAATLIAKPAGRIKLFVTDFTRQNTPNPYYGDSSTQTLTSKLDYGHSRDWVLTPSFAYSNSRILERSSSVSHNSGFRAQYRPAAIKGWIASIQFNNNRRTSSQAASSSSSSTQWSSSKDTQNKVSFTTRFIPGARMEWKNIYIITKDRHATYGENRASLTSSVSYIYSPSTKLGFTFNNETAPENSPGRTAYQFDTSTKLDALFSFGMNLKKEKQTGPQTSQYDGTLINMSLNAEF